MANLLGTLAIRPDLVLLRRSGLIYGSEEEEERSLGGRRGGGEQGGVGDWLGLGFTGDEGGDVGG